MKRLLRIRDPDYSLFADLARLLPLPPEGRQQLQNTPDEGKEYFFLDLLEQHRLGATHDLHEFPEGILKALRPSLPDPLRTTWQRIEEDVQALDPAPVEEVLRVIHQHLIMEDLVPRVFGTTHDFYVTVFVPRTHVYHFDRRLQRSTDAGLLPLCVNDTKEG